MIAWEQTIFPAVEADVAVTIIRFALVLNRGEGILKNLHCHFLVD